MIIGTENPLVIGWAFRWHRNWLVTAVWADGSESERNLHRPAKGDKGVNMAAAFLAQQYAAGAITAVPLAEALAQAPLPTGPVPLLHPRMAVKERNDRNIGSALKAFAGLAEHHWRAYGGFPRSEPLVRRLRAVRLDRAEVLPQTDALFPALADALALNVTTGARRTWTGLPDGYAVAVGFGSLGPAGDLRVTVFAPSPQGPTRICNARFSPGTALPAATRLLARTVREAPAVPCAPTVRPAPADVAAHLTIGAPEQRHDEPGLFVESGHATAWLCDGRLGVTLGSAATGGSLTLSGPWTRWPSPPWSTAHCWSSPTHRRWRRRSRSCFRNGGTGC
ncbi:hypothetical protein GCM10010441_29480 [Kitasatospora paracochleata]|uniref:Uncharacterized protein n=1 Tax=Kitasatospora paracochleata TaxID=58354 RepID=A0ABT1J9M4_9ACTN|nr:hypothetical protein [Kitasatospora paracochleata]MCP2313909.1 hypothetical protein [Kitasatospora paracochleata]